METILNYGLSATQTQLQSQLFYKDTGDISAADYVRASNRGLLSRGAHTEASRVVEMEGPVYIDIAQQNRFILNGIQINYKFWPSSNAFRIMSPAKNANFKVELQEAVLKVCMVDLAPELILGHAETLKTGPAMYFYENTVMKSYSIPRGQYECNIEDMYNGNVPIRLVVGLVSSKGFMGNYEKNPFNFAHYSCSFMGLYVNGVSKPAEPFTPNYVKRSYLSAYLSTFGDEYQKDFGNVITRDDYGKGYALYVFDLCRSTCDWSKGKSEKGHTRLNMKFTAPLEEPVTVILMGKFPGLVHVDLARNVNIVSDT
jgi:hypothetical protein